MTSLRLVIPGILAAFLHGSASAQAVQWKQSEGGNGHWYVGVPGLHHWTEAKPLAESVGGYLLTLTSQSEADWVWADTAHSSNARVTHSVLQIDRSIALLTFPRSSIAASTTSPIAA